MAVSEKTICGYTELLEAELIPAMGCTEPIAVAYGAAVAKKLLEETPEEVWLSVSGNIIKNVKSVVVPNTGGLKGQKVAVAAGIAAGDPARKLEVISQMDEAGREEMRRLLRECPIHVQPAQNDVVFYIQIKLRSREGISEVCIQDDHLNIVSMKKDGQIIFEKAESASEEREAYGLLNARDILENAQTVDLALVKPVLERQIAYNTAISEEGLTGKWGAAIGLTLLKNGGESIDIQAAAAALDSA